MKFGSFDRPALAGAGLSCNIIAQIKDLLEFKKSPCGGLNSTELIGASYAICRRTDG